VAFSRNEVTGAPEPSGEDGVDRHLQVNENEQTRVTVFGDAATLLQAVPHPSIENRKRRLLDEDGSQRFADLIPQTTAAAGRRRTARGPR
jgi:hypothetical protein